MLTLQGPVCMAGRDAKPHHRCTPHHPPTSPLLYRPHTDLKVLLLSTFKVLTSSYS